MSCRSGTPEPRSIPGALFLSVVTFGLYLLYWMHCLDRDTDILTGERKKTVKGPALILLTVATLGVYSIFWARAQGSSLQAADPREDEDLPLMLTVLQAAGYAVPVTVLVSFAVMQHRLNGMTGKKEDDSRFRRYMEPGELTVARECERRLEGYKDITKEENMKGDD